MEWSHTLLGQYDVGADNLAIDLARNFMDPVQAELVHVHEVTHAVLSRTTDMGLASKPIYAHIERFSHLNKQEKEAVIQALYDAQVLPQEGLASLMECLHLARKIGPKKAKQYAKDNFPPDYYKRFEQLIYCVDMSQRYRDFFYLKVPALAMEAGFREVAPAEDLLRSPEQLRKFLENPNRNPTLRLEKINEALSLNPWLVTKPIPEIAAASGIEFYEPVSKQVVADYMNYIGSLAGLGGTYTAELVGDAPGPAAILDAARGAVITNINHNFGKDSEYLMTETDIDWEANHADCAMVTTWPYYGEREKILEQGTGLKPEVGFALFRRTGEKYICFLPKDKATALIDGPLATKTLIAKPDQINIVTGAFSLSKSRFPDLVYYDHPETLRKRLIEEKDKLREVENLNLGTIQEHPYRITMFRVNGKRPLHVANSFGDANISNIMSALPKVPPRIPDELTRSEYRDAINDYFGFMGLPWQFDWVSIILDQEIKQR